MSDDVPGYSVVYLSSIDWEFRRQDHQFICLELAARGHDVVFVENTGARMPGLRDLGRIVSRLRNWSRALRAPTAGERVRVVSPLAIPGGALSVERSLNRRLLRLQTRPLIDSLPGRLVLWIGLPTWAAVDLIDIVKPDLIVYYCGDAFAEVPGVRQALRTSEREVVARSDLVIANSAALVEHCRRLGAREALFVPVAIDLTASEDARSGRVPMPAELAGLPGRLIGYMGGLNHKVDLPLLEAVARAFPDDTLVVLGSVEDPRHRPAAPNVVVLGERSYDDIGGYLVRFAVCLIPYVVNEFTISVYPGKLSEYLALCRPVVSTPLPEVLPYAAVVDVARTPTEFVAAVAAALERPDTPEVRAERLAWASRNSYGKLVPTMVEAAEALLRAKPARG